MLPALRDAEAAGAIDGWWYTRKHPCWRLRLRVRPTTGARLTVGADLDRLVADGHLQRWWPGIYEPETAAFGGAAGMTAAHALFITDSREAQQLRQRGNLAVGPRELSVLLCRRTAGARRRVGCRLPRRGAGTRPRRPGRNARPRAATSAQLPRDLPLEPTRTVHARTEHPGLGSPGGHPPHGKRGMAACGPSRSARPLTQGLLRDFQRCPRDFRGTFRRPKQQPTERPERASDAGRRPFRRQSRRWRQTSRAVRRVLSPGRLAAAGETAIHLGPALLPVSCGLPANSGGQPSNVRAGPSRDGPS